MCRALRLDMMDCVGVAANLNYRLDNPAVRRVRLAHANAALDPGKGATRTGIGVRSRSRLALRAFFTDG